METRKPIIAISQGDTNGIGLEVILKAFDNDYTLKHCTPVLYANQNAVIYNLKEFNIQYRFNKIMDIKDAKVGMLNVVNIGEEGDEKVNFGNPSKNSGKQALNSIVSVLKVMAADKADVMVTAPIDKSNISIENGEFKGHTGYIADELGDENPLMLLFKDDLKVSLVTTHIPISEISQNLTQERISLSLASLMDSLQKDFFVDKPKIAVLGLNPHSGDKGLMGKEELEIIRPVIEEFANSGHLVKGPYAADGFFGSEEYKKYDAILAMYHDQGLAPFKTLAKNNGVNFTANISIVRTSPDHGTGFDIAGKGIANASSFRNAVMEGIKIFKNRQESKELASNPLGFSEKRGDFSKMDF